MSEPFEFVHAEIVNNCLPLTIVYLSIVHIYTLPDNWCPSCLQATLASTLLQLESHTDPQNLL